MSSNTITNSNSGGGGGLLSDMNNNISLSQIVNRLIQLIVAELEERPQRFLIDMSLLFCFIYVIFSKSYKIPKPTKLTPEEVNDLLNEWTPEPLLPIKPQKLSSPRTTEVALSLSSHHHDDNHHKTTTTTSSSTATSTTVATNGNIVSSALETKFTLQGKNDPVHNFATFNFLGLVGDRDIIAKCKETILKYGVGSCGPRGFYGTIDVHLEQERRLAEFLGTDACILYSYGFCTISSVIPAFSKRGDIILYDQGVNFATQQGIELSRTSAQSFKHNDLNDLERLLREVVAKDTHGRRPVKNRRFIVINGVYENYGDVAPLAKMIQLKHKYKFRIIMDDSFGFGVLGKNGRGTPEHCGVSIKDIDILSANLENSMATAGGFCVGSRQVVEHQRLSGLGYCFSASLPPFTATAGIEALKRLQKNGACLMKDLEYNIRLTFDSLSKVLPSCLKLEGSYHSPIMHIRYRGMNDTKATLKLFKQVVTRALDKNVAVVCPKYSKREINEPAPSIRIAVSAAHSAEDVQYCASVLKTMLHQLFQS